MDLVRGLYLEENPVLFFTLIHWLLRCIFIGRNRIKYWDYLEKINQTMRNHWIKKKRKVKYVLKILNNKVQIFGIYYEWNALDKVIIYHHSTFFTLKVLLKVTEWVLCKILLSLLLNPKRRMKGKMTWHLIYSWSLNGKVFSNCCKHKALWVLIWR